MVQASPAQAPTHTEEEEKKKTKKKGTRRDATETCPGRPGCTVLVPAPANHFVQLHGTGTTLRNPARRQLNQFVTQALPLIVRTCTEICGNTYHTPRLTPAARSLVQDLETQLGIPRGDGVSGVAEWLLGSHLFLSFWRSSWFRDL